MLISVDPTNPQPRQIKRIADGLRQGNVIAYPTDTIYGLGCNIFNSKGVKRLYQLKKRDPRKPFSFICADISDVANYCQVSNFAYRIMKRHLPGPYTFVLDATRQVPGLLVTRQKTVGIRIPDNPVALAIVRELGHPLVTTSVNETGEEPLVDPFEIESFFGRSLDMVVDGGIMLGDPSTVISLIDDKIVVLRQGSAETSWITNA
ncbi:MAG: threonylcarbamoyl-AMP synthase [Desulfuromonadales bacterium]|nr:threonylcarbamoyl-AMP synthase [Desulfuromonadales bacterium]